MDNLNLSQSVKKNCGAKARQCDGGRHGMAWQGWLVSFGLERREPPSCANRQLLIHRDFARLLLAGGLLVLPPNLRPNISPFLHAHFSICLQNFYIRSLIDWLISLSLSLSPSRTHSSSLSTSYSLSLSLSLATHPHKMSLADFG